MPRFGGKSLIGRSPYITVAQGGTRWANNADYVCDGVADEVEINLAIIAAAYGGGVLLYPGTYTRNNSILFTEVTPGVHLMALSPQRYDATRIRSSGALGTPCIRLLGTPTTFVDSVKISGLGITGDIVNGTSAEHGIQLDYAQATVIDHCWIHNMGGNGIHEGITDIEHFNYRTLVTGETTIQACNGNGVFLGSGSSGFKMQGGEIRTNLGRGVISDPGTGPTTASVLFDTVLFQSNSLAAVYLDGGYGWTIDNCYFEVNNQLETDAAQVIFGPSTNIAFGCKYIGGYMTGASRDLGIYLRNARGCEVNPGWIAGHLVRNIDVATSGGGITCDSNKVIFDENEGEMPGGAVASRNQGGASIFVNRHQGSPAQAFNLPGLDLAVGRSLEIGIRKYNLIAITFDNLDTTPQVHESNDFIASNTIATTITNFSNGITGQTIRILFTNGNTTIQNNANIINRSGGNITPGANTTRSYHTWNGTVWYEVS